MRRSIISAAGAIALFASVSLAGAQDAVPDAAEFMSMAAMSDKFEIESSELALQNAQSEEVKSFAQQMITDHTANTEKLMQVAESGGGALEPPTELDEKHQAMMVTIQGASGEAFDAAYIDAQVQAHEEAVALMSGYAESGDNEPLKAFASEALPVIQMHYEMVQKMDGGM